MIKLKEIIKNFSFLGIIQIITLVIPLITYPISIKALGSAEYGKFVLTISIISYASIFVNFGFNTTGTIKISKSKTKEQLQKNFVTILTTKFLLTFTAAFATYTITNLIRGLDEIMFITKFALILLISDLLLPLWYYQGRELFLKLTIFTLIGKIISATLVIVFVNDGQDLMKLILATIVGPLVTSLLALYFSYLDLKPFKSTLPSWEEIYSTIIESFSIFFTNILHKSQTLSIKILIESKLGLSALSIFDLGEKLITIARIPQGIFWKIVLPKNDGTPKRTYHIGIINIVMNLCALTLFIIFLKDIIKILSPKEIFEKTYKISKIMSPLIVIFGLTNHLSVQVLTNRERYRLLNFSIIITFLIFIISVLILLKISKLNLNIIASFSVGIELTFLIVMWMTSRLFIRKL